MSKWNMRGRISEVVSWRIPMLLVLLGLALVVASGSMEAQDEVVDGVVIYDKLCAACHGKSGDGRGRAARYVFPHPRNLRHDQFRLVSTLSRKPSRDDIRGVLEDGVPGTSMQSWKTLGAEKLDALVNRVLQLREEGAVERIDREIQQAGNFDSEQAMQVRNEYVRRAMMAGPQWKGVPDTTVDAALIGRGEKIYRQQKCNSCHGERGRGSVGMDLVDQRGDPTWATDLISDPLHGGSDRASIARRIHLGMPGSAMPSSENLAEADLQALVAYCMSLAVPPARSTTNYQRRARAIGYFPVKNNRKSP